MTTNDDPPATIILLYFGIFLLYYKFNEIKPKVMFKSTY
jgi:hypothetical protein